MRGLLKPTSLAATTGALALALALAGCGQPEAPQAAPEAATVLVTKVQSGPLSVSDELPGRVIAFRTAEIRPQVGGIIQHRLFEQGSEVRAGQPLFQINAAPFAADSASANATLQRAEATYSRARIQVDRLKPLVGADAISRQSYDDAVVARDQAAADVAAARAALNRRRLDVGFARVTSPISGIIGETRVTEGALVGAGDTNPLATVQQIDQVYIDVRQPAERFEVLREAVRAGTADPRAPVQILSQSGTPYPDTGRMLFSGITVDPGTGNAVVRVLAPNPARRLLPGMFVRVRLPRSAQANAITVPQQAVTRDPAGAAEVSVIDSQGRAHKRAVVVSDVVDGRYIVRSGLKAGETIVVEGQDRILPDVPVNTRPWRATPPASGR